MGRFPRNGRFCGRIKDFIKKYDPTWGGEEGDLLFNLEFDTIYGDTDIDWMITLLAAHEGRAPGPAGWLLKGTDPEDIYAVGKMLWIIIDAWRDENVDLDFGRYGQENEKNAIKAARDLIQGRRTLADLFGGLNCSDVDDREGGCGEGSDASGSDGGEDDGKRGRRGVRGRRGNGRVRTR